MVFQQISFYNFNYFPLFGKQGEVFWNDQCINPSEANARGNWNIGDIPTYLVLITFWGVVLTIYCGLVVCFFVHRKIATKKVNSGTAGTSIIVILKFEMSTSQFVLQ